MLAFRSEEHVERWCRARLLPKGETFTLEQAWELARAWYRDKLSPEWERATPDQAQALFESIGLTGDFWRLGPAPA